MRQFYLWRKMKASSILKDDFMYILFYVFQRLLFWKQWSIYFLYSDCVDQQRFCRAATKAGWCENCYVRQQCEKSCDQLRRQQLNTVPLGKCNRWKKKGFCNPENPKHTKLKMEERCFGTCEIGACYQPDENVDKPEWEMVAHDLWKNFSSADLVVRARISSIDFRLK